LANRKILVDALTNQYSRLNSPLSSLVRNNINLLIEENTFTITTGHQLNIFTGPLYFIFKIVTAINLANELKAAYPEQNFVPVYWMATEDHDFAEINHTTVLGKKINWDLETTGPTGRINTESIFKTVKNYLSVLGLSENSEILSDIIENAYLKNQKLADATRYLVNSLFEDYGLVIIDADDPQLKKQFAPYIERDIIGRNSSKAINESSAALKQIGFNTQVNSRDINFFYMVDGFRERIVVENGKYNVLNSGISFNEDELRKEIEQHPFRFSPNVVMRPLYQEVILPNLAYIGGGAEVTYWLQLKKSFDL
jgi:bacillithiol biosynthesis cysteine-adding enzyme BshC